METIASVSTIAGLDITAAYALIKYMRSQRHRKDTMLPAIYAILDLNADKELTGVWSLQYWKYEEQKSDGKWEEAPWHISGTYLCTINFRVKKFGVQAYTLDTSSIIDIKQNEY